MQELTKGVQGFLQTFPPEEDDRPDHEKQLQAVAERWACWCLRCFRDDLLKKGLAVSVAMADFLAELELAKPEEKHG